MQEEKEKKTTNSLCDRNFMETGKKSGRWKEVAVKQIKTTN